MSTQGQWSGLFDGDWFGAVDGGSVVNLSATLAGSGGVVSAFIGTANQTYAGWHVFPNTRRKKKKQIHAERASLGVDKQKIEQTARKVVELPKTNRVVDKTKIDYYYRPDIADLTALLMAELRLTVKSPDYTQAIQLALASKLDRDNQDDEEALLLLM